MSLLSVPFTPWLDSVGGGALLDTVVIGSGYGGSVAALRMAQKGYSVVLLERGSEYLPGDFPNDIGQLPKFLRLPGQRGPTGRATGLFDWHAGPGVASLVANGLGGGSLINAGVMMRPQDDVFAQPAWPDAIRLRAGAVLRDAAGKDRAPFDLDRAFALAESELRPQAFQHNNQPGDAVANLPKSQALKRLGQALTKHVATRRHPVHIGPAQVTIDLDQCTRCGDCFTGCNVPGAKQTLRDSYLARAQAAGAVLVSGALVWSIEPLDDGTWNLRCLATERSNHRASLADSVLLDGAVLRARRVIIAAGTFGSTELLQRSKAQFGDRFGLSPTLGSRLSANGDSISISANEPERVGALGHGAQTLGNPAPVGPTITTVIDLRDRPALHERLVIQDGATPGALVRMCQELLATTWAINHIGARWRAPRHALGGETDPLAAPRDMAERAQLLLTMGHDESAGRIVWVADMNASVPYWVRPEEAATYKHQEAVFRAVDALGAKHLHAPTWRPLPESARGALNGPLPEPTLLTVHPLGGCAMGDSVDSGVVDDQGRVWKRPGERWPSLWVLDGAIVPTSLGCNPMWTITALAERALCFVPDNTEPVWQMPARRAAPLPVQRAPEPLRRDHEPAFEVRLSERLEQPDLPLHGALRSALGAKVAQADLRVNMRTPDWSALWETRLHRFDDVSGRLRLVATTANGTARLTYRIRSGHVDLLSAGRPWPLIGSLLHWAAVLRAAATWLVLRGWREFLTTYRNEGLAGVISRFTGAGSNMWLILRQAAVSRTMRYALTLDLVRAANSRPGDAELSARAPATLALTGIKQVRYAATVCQLLRHVWRALRGDPTLSPADLRPAYLDQITRPDIRLVPAGPSARWRSWLPWGVTRARFAFDMQSVFQRSPVALLSGGDTSTAMLSLLAYPALLLRHALHSHLLDFRLPDYSGKPLVEAVACDDLLLRAEPAGRPSGQDIRPELIPLQVRCGRSSSDDGNEDLTPIDLPLWRYRRLDSDGGALPPEVVEGAWHGQPVCRVKSVLLMHAFGMSGSTFTFKTTECNLAEHLYAQGYEVWILDTRMSPRAAGSQRQSTLDQVGLIDTPRAVDCILGVLQAELQPKAPLQIFSFAHCMGATGMLIALLSGKLSHPVSAWPMPGGASIEQQLPKLAGLVCSQAHPFMVGSRKSQAKTWVATLVRDLLRRSLLPLAVRGPVTSALESFTDRVFASMPVPAGEHCPDEGRVRRAHDDDCATCRRIRFIDGELFKHRNLNRCTHEALPALFGDANVRLFAQGARMVEYERLINEDGLNSFVTDEAVTRHLGLPLRFVHGALNDLFDPESATRSAEQFARLQPAWSAQFASQPGSAATADLIEGYGHLDPLIGRDAWKPLAQGGPSVYQRLTALFDKVLIEPSQPAPVARAAAAAVQVRFPKVGPWVGPVMGPQGQQELRIAFAIDDMDAEVSPAQADLQASAIVHGLAGELQPKVVRLEIKTVMTPLVAIDGFSLPLRRPGALDPTVAACMVRVAHGTISLPPGTGSLRIEAVSHGRVPGAPDDAPADLGGLRAAIRGAVRQVWHMRQEANQPFAATRSQLRLQPIRPHRRWVHLPPQALAALGPHDEVRIALGSCRYPGFPFDRQRADESFARLLDRVRGAAHQRPHLAVMLGDQIYADATAGFLDPLSAVERYVKRHADAFRTPALQRLLARLPTVMTPDDHEFVNGFPNGPPLFRGTARRANYAKVRARGLYLGATDALEAFQKMTQRPAARRAGCCAVELGPVRCLVLDTRSQRQPATAGKVRMLSKLQRRLISCWLRQGKGGNQLHVVCNGSVVWPPLVPGSDPANPGASDTWQDALEDRQWLLGQLVEHVPHRFVVVAGDYHLSFSGLLECNGQAVGACIVAPPFYAPLPYANSQPCHLDLDATLDLGATPGQPEVSRTLRLKDPVSPVRGSGYAVLAASNPAGAGWLVRMETELVDLDSGGEWVGPTALGSWRL